VPADRFGPNTRKVESFLDCLAALSAQQWQHIQAAAPLAGAAPELEATSARPYLNALVEATRAAKSSVFPGSETAFFEAMRIAHHRAATLVAGLAGTARLVPSRGTSQNPETDDPEAILEMMSEEFENETWQRAVNACMVAAAALVLRDWLKEVTFRTLYAPVAKEVSAG
jgi:hypothetical protein